MGMIRLMTDRVVAVQQRGTQFAAAVFTQRGLFRTSLPRPSLDHALKSVDGVNLPRSSVPEHLRVLDMVFDIAEGIPVDPSGIAFDFSNLSQKEISVLRALLSIPRGRTITYGQLAELAGLPGAARFVGNVMARNRFAPLIPCHRVISTKGLGGYGLGLDLKRKLLRREGAI